MLLLRDLLLFKVSRRMSGRTPSLLTRRGCELLDARRIVVGFAARNPGTVVNDLGQICAAVELGVIDCWRVPLTLPGRRFSPDQASPTPSFAVGDCLVNVQTGVRVTSHSAN